MASLAYLVMTAAYNASRNALDSEDFEAAFELGKLESLVNNVHHGLSSEEWVPRVYASVTPAQKTILDSVLRVHRPDLLSD